MNEDESVRVRPYTRRKPAHDERYVRASPFQSLQKAVAAKQATPIRPRPGRTAHTLRIKQLVPKRPERVHRERVRGAKSSIKDAKRDLKRMKGELKQVQAQCRSNVTIAKGDVVQSKVNLKDAKMGLKEAKLGIASGAPTDADDDDTATF